jgi:hypothetical protein
VSNNPSHGQPPEKTDPPPDVVSTQVRTTPGSPSLIATNGFVCFVGEPGGTALGAGGGVVSS